MFTVQKLFTALALGAALTSGAMANESVHNLEDHTDYLVASALSEVKQDMTLSVTYDVLTASHTFEPDAENATTLVAEISITPIEANVIGKDNDA